MQWVQGYQRHIDQSSVKISISPILLIDFCCCFTHVFPIWREVIMTNPWHHFQQYFSSILFWNWSFHAKTLNFPPEEGGGGVVLWSNLINPSQFHFPTISSKIWSLHPIHQSRTKNAIQATIWQIDPWPTWWKMQNFKEEEQKILIPLIKLIPSSGSSQVHHRTFNISFKDFSQVIFLFVFQQRGDEERGCGKICWFPRSKYKLTETQYHGAKINENKLLHRCSSLATEFPSCQVLHLLGPYQNFKRYHEDYFKNYLKNGDGNCELKGKLLKHYIVEAWAVSCEVVSAIKESQPKSCEVKVKLLKDFIRGKPQQCLVKWFPVAEPASSQGELAFQEHWFLHKSLQLFSEHFLTLCDLVISVKGHNLCINFQAKKKSMLPRWIPNFLIPKFLGLTCTGEDSTKSHWFPSLRKWPNLDINSE